MTSYDDAIVTPSIPPLFCVRCRRGLGLDVCRDPPVSGQEVTAVQGGVVQTQLCHSNQVCVVYGVCVVCVWCVCACVRACTCVCVCVCVRTSTHVQCQPRERHSCFSMPVMCTLYQTTPTTSVLYSFTKSVHCSEHMGHVLTIERHRTVHQH